MMRCGRWHGFFLLIIGVVFTLTACIPGQLQTVRNVTVRLYVSGNEPFTHLAAEFPDGRVIPVSTASPQYEVLWRLQGKRIRILSGKIQQQVTPPALIIEKFEVLTVE